VPELPAIEVEVGRLLSIYGQNRSFYGYASQFLDFVAMRQLQERSYLVAPRPHPDKQLTFRDRLALAQCAADQCPLPPAWAHHWLTHDPNTTLGTPARRCPEEFSKLFEMLYRDRYGDGMLLPINRTQLTLRYRPASASFRGGSDGLSLSPDLPDVSVLTNPLKKLADVAEGACERLGRYSRAVGKDPTASRSFEALVELPVSLWPEQYRRQLESVRNIVARAGQPAAIPFSKFRTWIPEFEELTRNKLRALTNALASMGLGMEPDLRFGGAVPTLESRIVVFADDASTATEEASPRYLAASLALHLAAAVATVDGEVAEAERALMNKQMNGWVSLSESERRRLQALLRLLLTEPPKLTGLKKKLAALPRGARMAIGEFLVLVAQADNKVTPAEIRALQKIFVLLGLPKESVFSQVHSADTSQGEARSVPRSEASSDFIIPPPPPAARQPSNRKIQSAKNGLALDEARITALRRENDRVANLLETVFEATDVKMGEHVATPAESHPETEGTPPGLLGLDPAHSALLRTLLSRPQWTRGELIELAEDRNLLLEGALERLNDASFEKLEMPLFDDGDPLVLNQEAIPGVASACH
jgi:uncharacterized tellurite resistance protein B-like protein